MQIVILLVYVVAIGAMMYFLAIKPQKKQQKQQQELMDSIEKGDYVLTTSGFYGVIIDITDQNPVLNLVTIRTAGFQCRRKLLHRLKSQLQ
mgnify:CR=1 FL=1